MFAWWLENSCFIPVLKKRLVPLLFFEKLATWLLSNILLMLVHET